MADYRLGFHSLDEEGSAVDLPVDGTIPSWLDGVLLRNGPARFEAGGQALAHWFDGLAMVRRFAFEDGAVTYTNRFLRTEAYDRALGERGLGAAEFGTSPGGLLSGVASWVLPTPTDNTNVNVMRAGEATIALTETPRYTAFDPVTLETRGEWTFEDDLDGHLSCAHPVVLPAEERSTDLGPTFNLLTTFGRTHEYAVTRLEPGATSREVLARVETDRVGYMHSFAVTPSFVVLIEPPLYVNLSSLLNPFTGTTFFDALSWRPRRGSRFLVLARADGSLVAEIEGPPFFYFHQANASETEESVVVDLVTFEDASVLSALSLADLEAGDFSHPMGDLTRFRLDVAAESVEQEPRYEGHLSLPRIDERRLTRPYQYVYAQGATGSDRIEFPTGLRKIDVETGEARAYDHPDRYSGEPVFVPRPGGEREDAGVVVSVVLDTAREQSGLLVLDAETFEKLGIAWLPHVLPFDFHGQYFRSVDAPG